MKKMIILYGLSAVLFFLLDLVWLGVVAKGFYRRTPLCPMGRRNEKNALKWMSHAPI